MRLRGFCGGPGADPEEAGAAMAAVAENATTAKAAAKADSGKRAELLTEAA